MLEQFLPTSTVPTHTFYTSTTTSSSSEPRILLDLGCGPGLSTFSFVPAFDRVVGLDPSAGMIGHANQLLKGKEEGIRNKVEFRQGTGEDLLASGPGVGLEEASVDLVVAGQAAHWFDPEAVYSQLARVLKPGGSFVFFGYGEAFFTSPSSPSLTSLIPEYSGGLLKDYWQQPGRSIAESLLSKYPFPQNSSSSSSPSSWDPTSFRRDFFLRAQGESPMVSSNEVHVEAYPLLLDHDWSLKDMERYLRTWSSAHTYDEKHGPGTDVVSGFVSKLAEAGYGKGREGGKENVGWEMGLISGRRSI